MQLAADVRVVYTVGHSTRTLVELVALLDDAERRQGLANQSRQLVDGLGALRVAWALFAAAPSQG